MLAVNAASGLTPSPAPWAIKATGYINRLEMGNHEGKAMFALYLYVVGMGVAYCLWHESSDPFTRAFCVLGWPITAPILLAYQMMISEREQ